MSQRLLALVAIAAAGCAGPGVRFDPGPLPEWTLSSTRVSGGVIEAVGSAPATLDPNRDSDLAVRDAEGRIARMVESQIVARSSDWTLSVTGPSEQERQVVSQSIEIRSRVRIEDVQVVGSHRDEATRTQYVRIRLDREAWARRVQRRLDQGLRELENRLGAARAALASQRALQAYELARAGSGQGSALEPDVLLCDVLMEEGGYRTRLIELLRRLEGLERRVVESHPFAIEIDAPAGPVRRLRADLQDFLKSYGFGVRNADGAIRVSITLGQVYLRTERVADRTEYVHAATGEVLVRDADGSPLERLGLLLPRERYVERDVVQEAAARKALQLAADSVASGFRSMFREAFPAQM
jgi:hypothetical protein